MIKFLEKIRYDLMEKNKTGILNAIGVLGYQACRYRYSFDYVE
jgi:hypothetical protein